MLDHQGQISIPATAVRRPVHVSALILYSLAYVAADFINNDNLAMYCYPRFRSVLC